MTDLLCHLIHRYALGTADMFLMRVVFPRAQNEYFLFGYGIKEAEMNGETNTVPCRAASTQLFMFSELEFRVNERSIILRLLLFHHPSAYIVCPYLIIDDIFLGKYLYIPKKSCTFAADLYNILANMQP